MPIKHSSNSLYNPILPQVGYPQAMLVRGRVGYAYVFRQYGFRRTIGHYYYPYDPNTWYMQQAREKFGDSVYMWQHFKNNIKQYYIQKVERLAMTGFNYWIRQYMLYG